MSIDYKYKETGIEWIPCIPVHWQIRRIASTFAERVEIVSDQEYSPLSVTKNGILPQLETAAKTDHGDNRKKVCKNDFVINSRSDRKGSGGISPYDGSVSVISIVLKPSRVFDSDYLHYLLTNINFQEEFYKQGKGIVADLWSTKYQDMKTIILPIPPIEEQIRISTFINAKLQKIYKFIQKKQRFIELLKEQKQNITNQAISKGIKDNTKMKQSNIDILGTIPFHWQLVRIKHLFQEISERSEDGKGSLLMASQEFGLVERAKYHAKAEVAQSTIGHKVVKKGDLVFNKLKAHLGVFFESNYDGLVSPDYAVYRPNDCVNAKYYELLFRHPAFIKQFIINSTGIVEGLTRLYTSEFFSIKVPFPSKEEACEIVNFINNETKRINSAIAKAEREIELIKEYKEAMIAEAVMGEITSERNK